MRNTDGFILDVIGGKCMILRDHSGGIIFNSYRHLFSCNDVLEAEILAIREVYVNFFYQTIYLQSGLTCQKVINQAKSPDQCNLQKVY